MGVATAGGLETTSAQITIEVEGAPLNPIVKDLLVSAEVETTMYLPSQFKIVFRGPSTKVLELGGFQLGANVSLQVTSGAMPEPKPLMSLAEITGVDLEYGPDGKYTIVRGMDWSHRLMRGTNSMAYPDMTASDVVTALILAAEIPPGNIEPTSSTYQWLSQPNISPWAFIQQLAERENYVAYVDSEGLFNFCPPPKPEEGPPPVLTFAQPAEGAALVLGKNLVRLRGTVNAAEQVETVTVTGYNPSEGMPVVAPFPTVPSTGLSIDPAVLPPVLAGEMSAIPYFDASRPVDNEGSAEKLAQSIAADIAGAVSEFEGQCEGNASIMAGRPLSLGLAGPPFDGQYICTAARHHFEPANGGYTTWFTVGGRRDRSLLALTGGGGTVPSFQGRINGLVIGKVVDNMDPDSLGRVKVMLPWMSDTYVSAWARTMQIGAGTGGVSGFLWIPEIGDEVLLGFDRGDIDHPFVIGGLYSGITKPEPGPSVDGVVASRRITSREMHTIQFNDGPDAMGIMIKSGDDALSIKIDAEEQTITIMSAAKVAIQAEAEITMQAPQISMTAETGITMTGADISLSGESSVSVTGATISLEGEGSASIAAASVSIEGEGDVAVSAPMVSLGG